MKKNIYIYIQRRLFYSLQLDSLGPMDLDIRSSKHTEDLNLNKSLDGLRRLIATSLDAFRNCSLFGFDSKKDTSNMVWNGAKVEKTWGQNVDNWERKCLLPLNTRNLIITNTKIWCKLSTLFFSHTFNSVLIHVSMCYLHDMISWLCRFHFLCFLCK